MPPWNFIPFPAHQLGFSVAWSLELSGCLLLCQFIHSCLVQPLASHGDFSCTTTNFDPLLLYFFLGTIFIGVCFVWAILPHQKYLELKLLATLLNRSARVGATSHTLALDWLESLAPCADLIASKQWLFSLWQLNSLDVFQNQNSLHIPISKFMSIFLVFFFGSLLVCCLLGIAGRKYQEGNVRRGEGFWSKYN